MEQIFVKQVLPNTIKRYFEGKQSGKITIVINKEEGKWKISIIEREDEEEETLLGKRTSLIN